MIAYKVFTARSGGPEFLFHRLRGSRIVTLDEWLDAEVKWAKEGSSPYYYTAFHVYKDIETIRRWVHSVRIFKDRFVTKVEVENVRPKPTNGKAVLAKRMRLTSAGWDNRTKLTEYVD